MPNEPTRILLLEDDDGDERLLRTMLARAPSGQFVLTRAGSLADALDRLKDDRFDVILADLCLPDSQGLDTFGWLHAQEPEIPIVILSGLADDNAALETVQRGAQDYLLKGQVNAVLLMRSLRYAIERKRAELERDRLIHELREALARVKVLSGLLPMCAWCKKIRDDKGYWSEVETYLRKNTDASVTHGICPDCVAQSRHPGTSQ